MYSWPTAARFPSIGHKDERQAGSRSGRAVGYRGQGPRVISFASEAGGVRLAAIREFQLDLPWPCRFSWGRAAPARARTGATAERLADERGLVYRYLAQDGLAGEEGTFLLCTFWLAQAQALAGEVDQAVATFERAVSAINDVGLLAEEIDADGEMIGNFPQAFSYIGLVNAAWAIAQAQQHAAAAVPTRLERGG
jgi:hypothetical protein